MKRLACALALIASAPCAACTVSTTGLSFSSYDVFSSLNQDITGAVSIRCSPAVGYSISLSPGVSNSFTPRTLTAGGYALEYNLFIDSARVTIWGDGTGGTSTVSDNAEDATHTVFGRIPARQNVHTGDYTDTIVVTITY